MKTRDARRTKQGNFAVAGHRNTHGEPFRYINKLKPGDPIVVETQDAYYTYEMASILPQTSPQQHERDRARCRRARASPDRAGTSR